MSNLENAILRDIIKKENKGFSYEEFFREDGRHKDYGATVVITSEQSVTIINEDNGRGYHNLAQEKICKAIYDLGMKRGTERKKYDKLRQSTIRFRVLNSGENIPNKLIWIAFPPSITRAQLEQLKAYQAKFGNQISKARKEYNDMLIGFYNSKLSSTMSVSDLQEVIDYAQTIPISRKKIKDNFIIGDTLPKNKMGLKTLLDLIFRALRRGITEEECSVANKDIEPHYER